MTDIFGENESDSMPDPTDDDYIDWPAFLIVLGLAGEHEDATRKEHTWDSANTTTPT